ncbi:hypothetical protein R3P38DRAFT_934656 [Favolaschia claudopus]|uniref:F-box domain-containing protein n=1 Tax=Favolaschia claudopus TaxID=2862362 RepID=A0AAW0BNV0_9AGAR
MSTESTPPLDLTAAQDLGISSSGLGPSFSPTISTLPDDVLGLMLQILCHKWFVDIRPNRRVPRFDFERCQGESLLGLSLTCRALRAQILPWIFREVYNWEASRGTVWPVSLWPYIKIVHIRDRTARDLRNLEITAETVNSLSMMPSLVKLTLRLESCIPSDVLRVISLSRSLLCFEIHQARFDGEFSSSSLSFPALETLVMSTAGFWGVVGQDDVERPEQAFVVDSLLKAVSDRLTELRISGDLISTTFPSIAWSRLRKLAITEHPPTPYIPVCDIVSNMPVLRHLEVLYTLDITGEDARRRRIFPSFYLGDESGRALSDSCPLLSVISLGNLLPSDPIFAQLPPRLPSFHLRAPVDPYNYVKGFPHHASRPFNEHTLPCVLPRLRHLQDLKELCLDLESFVHAALIHHIGLALPRIEVLEFGLPRYPCMSSPSRFNPADRNPTILTALNLFSHLLHLRIVMDFPVIYFDRRYPREVTAQWFLRGVPTLQTVSFAEMTDIYRSGFQEVSWDRWDRGVFDFVVPTSPPTPPPPPPKPFPVTQTLPLPAWKRIA